MTSSTLCYAEVLTGPRVATIEEAAAGRFSHEAPGLVDVLDSFLMGLLLVI